MTTSNHDPLALHRLSCIGYYNEISLLLQEDYYKNIINIRDLHGYPCIHYAIHFGYKNIVELLIKNGADPTKKSVAGWSCLQEACGRRDIEIVKLILEQVKLKLETDFENRKPSLIQAIENLPDFELELKWEIKSWVPLVTRFCPYDTYKVYKRGSSFRVDTTIIGVDGIKFKRGNLSFLFVSDRLFSLDNIKKTYSELSMFSKRETVLDDEVKLLMLANIKRVKLLTDKIEFSPAKTWFGSEKWEYLGENRMWNAKTYDVDGINLKVITRKSKNRKSPFNPELIKDIQEMKLSNGENGEISVTPDQIEGSIDNINDGTIITTTTTTTTSTNPTTEIINSPPIKKSKSLNELFEVRESAMKNKIMGDISYFKVPEGFDPVEHENNIDKSKLKSVNGLFCEGETFSESHKYFKGTIWMSSDFPRKVTDLLPIFEVLAPTNKLFSRMNEFISLKLPSQGFPVKFDFPVFPTITATVIFNKYVEREINESYFQIPSDYTKKTKKQQQYI